MTALDRAFIRAFDEAGAPTTRPRETSAPKPAAKAAPALASTVLPPERKAPAVAPVAAPAPKPSLMAPPAIEKKIPATIAPLSSFTARQQANDALHALLEVDHLIWPRACQDLISTAQLAWHDFIAELALRIADGKKCIAITSGRRGEGRTTLALAVGKQLAAHGLKGAIADADFENPKLARTCGIAAQMGWGEACEADLPLGEALIAANADRITLMPWRGSHALAAEVLDSPLATASLKVVRDHFDFVIVDTMPLENQAAADNFARIAKTFGIDTCYLVRDVRWTMPEELAETSDRLARLGLAPAGIIENFVHSAEPMEEVQLPEPAAHV